MPASIIPVEAVSRPPAHVAGQADQQDREDRGDQHHQQDDGEAPPAEQGLGLPLTKVLVEANRAAMSITSVKKEGTLVEITFPPQRLLAG